MNNNSGSTEDQENRMERFGWKIIGNSPIPYIYRGEKKYCSVRMMEMKVLKEYLHCSHQAIYDCTSIKSYYITEQEMLLLNKINAEHCYSFFGTAPFTKSDLVVKLSDAVELYSFVSSCCQQNSSKRNGFIRVNNDSAVPYVVSKHKVYLPLFYFEDRSQTLHHKAQNLKGWDLCYLKFCFKRHGIREALYAQDFCTVVRLKDVKPYFPTDTVFEDYWPENGLETKKQSHRVPNPIVLRSPPTIGSNQLPGLHRTNAAVDTSTNHAMPDSCDSQPPPMMPIKEFLANGGVISPDIVKNQQRRAQMRKYLEGDGLHSAQRWHPYETRSRDKF